MYKQAGHPGHCTFANLKAYPVLLSDADAVAVAAAAAAAVLLLNRQGFKLKLCQLHLCLR
jgi:hypothetical protein